MIRVVVCPNPLEESLAYCDIEPGLNLLEIVGQPHERIYATVNGVPVPPEAWESTFPADEEIVTLVVRPHGIIEGIVAAIAAAVEAAAMAGATAGLTVAGAVGVTGTLGSTIAAVVGGVIGVVAPIASLAMGIVSAVVRPQMPTHQASAEGNRNRFFSLTSGSNQTRPWGYIPKLYGTFRITPPLGSNYYTHVDDNEQYIHVLLCLGYGPLQIGPYVFGASAGQQFLDSRDGHQLYDQPYTNTLQLGDVSFSAHNNIVWQIGTVSAVMNPPNGRSAIYSQDVDEDGQTHTFPPQVDLGYSDDDTRWIIDGKTYATTASYVFTSQDNCVAVGFDIVIPALYTVVSVGEKGTVEDGGGIWIDVTYKPTDAPDTAYRDAPLRKHATASLFDGSDEPKVEGGLGGVNLDMAWVIQGKTKDPKRRTNGFDIERHPNNPSLDRWGNPIGSVAYSIKIRRSRVIKSKHAVSPFCTFEVVNIRTFRNSQAWTPHPHVNTDDVILMALRFKATGRINGTLDQISVLATSVLPDYDQYGNPMGYAATANPARIYADILRGSHLTEDTKVPAADIDWLALYHWKLFCNGYLEDGTPNNDALGRPRVFTYNWYHEEGETMLDRLRAVASTGRASWAYIDGKISVIRDNKYTPVQVISPRNSRNFEFTKNYPKVPHALRVQWVNPGQNASMASWQPDELLVLDDGYYQRVGGEYYDPFGNKISAPAPDGLIHNPPLPNDPAVPLKPPTLFEVLETQGVTDRHQAYCEGRMYLAVMRMRRETYKVDMDIENLVATRGDCVYIAHDALVIGWSSGRIIGREYVAPGDGYTYLVLKLDEQVQQNPELGQKMCLRIRSADPGTIGMVNSFIVRVGDPDTPWTDTLVCWANTPQALLDLIQVGDLFVYGTYQTETLQAKITQIDYRPDLSATITAVPAAPSIWTSDTQPINEDFPGSIPDPEPELRSPLKPSFDALTAPLDDVVITPDGLRCKVKALWSIPLGGNGSVPDFVYLHYTIDNGSTWKVKREAAALGIIVVDDVPTKTFVTAFLQSFNSGNGKFSAPTENHYVTTPDVNAAIPYAPAALTLIGVKYRDGAGEDVYEIRCSWRIHGFSSNVEIQWANTEMAEGVDPWPGQEDLGGGVTSRSIRLNPEDFVDNVHIYYVRVRNFVLVDDVPRASRYTQASVTIYKLDVPPPALTDLKATSAKDDAGNTGIHITWEYPLYNGAVHPDVKGVEIYQSRFNEREGGEIDGTPVPPAELLVNLTDLESEEYFYTINDRAFHYFWARTFDENGNRSPWKFEASNAGVRAFAGIKGDGAPPPPPIIPGDALTPDNWQVTIVWEQPSPLPSDYLGTKVWARDITGVPGPDYWDNGEVDFLGYTDKHSAAHLRLEDGHTYAYWLANTDTEGLESTPRTFVGTATVECSFDKYIPIIKSEQITANLIDTRGLTIRDPVNEEIIFGAGAALKPSWLLEIIDGNPDAFIRTGAILNAYVGGDAQTPGFIRSFEYNPTYQEGDLIQPGIGWAVKHDGTAEFGKISARGSMGSEMYSKGQYGWKVLANGDCEFNQGVFRGQVSADALLLGTDIPLRRVGEIGMGRAIIIEPSGHYFAYDAAGLCQSNNTLTFDVYNVPNVVWSAQGYLAGSSEPHPVTLAVSGDSRTLHESVMRLNNFVRIAVRAQVVDRYDEIEVFRLTQNSGLLTWYLTNKILNISADNNGYVLSYAGAYGYIHVFNGADNVTKNCVFMVQEQNPAECTATVVSDPASEDHGRYQVTSLSAQTGTVIFSITYSGSTYQIPLTVTKHKASWLEASGQMGTRAFYATGNYSAATWASADDIVRGILASGGVVYVHDVLTLRNDNVGAEYVETRSRGIVNGAAVWQALQAFVDGNMIVRGAITTNHLTANSINAGHIQANTINAWHIQANTIDVNHLKAKVITADKIYSGSIGKIDTLYVDGMMSGSENGTWLTLSGFGIAPVYWPKNPGKLVHLSFTISMIAANSVKNIYLTATSNLGTHINQASLFYKDNRSLLANHFCGTFAAYIQNPSSGGITLDIGVYVAVAGQDVGSIKITVHEQIHN